MTRRARIIDHHGTVEEVSGATFFERIFGHPPLTKEQREDEWRASIERYADMIEAGGDWGVPPPCLADARALVAEREAEQLTQTVPDPLKRRFG